MLCHPLVRHCRGAILISTMTAGTFDTLAAARELAEAGMERRQAEAVAAAIRAGQGELATREDVAGVRTEVRTLQWAVAVPAAISLATLGCVVAMLATVLSAS